MLDLNKFENSLPMSHSHECSCTKIQPIENMNGLHGLETASWSISQIPKLTGLHPSTMKPLYCTIWLVLDPSKMEWRLTFCPVQQAAVFWHLAPVAPPNTPTDVPVTVSNLDFWYGNFSVNGYLQSMPRVVAGSTAACPTAASSPKIPWEELAEALWSWSQQWKSPLPHDWTVTGPSSFGGGGQSLHPGLSATGDAAAPSANRVTMMALAEKRMLIDVFVRARVNTSCIRLKMCCGDQGLAVIELDWLDRWDSEMMVWMLKT